MSDPNNPFVGLLRSSELRAAVNTENLNASTSANLVKTQEESDAKTINNLVENIFYFTINPNALDGQSDRQLVYLEELAEASKPHKHIDLETLEQALFERLLLQNIESCVLPKATKSFKEHVIQKHVFPYLFSSMQNLQSYERVGTTTVGKSLFIKIKELIFRNAVTALKQPALFEDQDFSKQLVGMLQHVDPQSHTFFIDIVKAFVLDGKIF